MGCAESSPADCATESEISTNPVEAEGTAGSGEARLLFKPKTGKTLATLIFDSSGGGCAVEGEKPLTGMVVLNTPTLEEERTLQAIEGLGSLEQGPYSLQLAGNGAYIEGGNASLKLASGKPWALKGPKVLINETFIKFELAGGGKAIAKLVYTNDGPGVWRPGAPAIGYPAGNKNVWKITNKCAAAALAKTESCEVEVEFIAANGAIGQRNEVEVTLAPAPKAKVVGIRTS